MDPLTHALAGATIAWSLTGRQLNRKSLLLGAAAGLLPDADVVIRSATDPLLAIQHHRGFTHSLLFIPIGALLATLPFLRTVDRKSRAYLAALCAYASHPLLDSATTYGTQLFWPFSNYRVGLDIISIIDPGFTLILIAALFAAFASRRNSVIAALSLAILWLAAGVAQRERALDAQQRLATSRNDERSRGEVFPTIGNTIVWRSIYRSGDTLRIDRIRVPWFGSASYAATTSVPVAVPWEPSGTSGASGTSEYLGASVPGKSSASTRRNQPVTRPRGTEVLQRPEVPSRDFLRFAWFSDGWIARDPADPTVIGDARYSLRADSWSPVWGIRLHEDPNRPTEWINHTRTRRTNPKALWKELTGDNLNFRPIP